MALAVAIPAVFAAKTQRADIDFDFDWKFTLSDGSADYSPADGVDTSGWSDVQLPHDWNITQHFVDSVGGSPAWLPDGVGWYRKTFTAPKGDRVRIMFDGIFMQSDVWVNGHHLGHRPYGFCSIEYDLTPYLRQGDNVIAVRADTRGGRPRWYAGGGIYRHAHLRVMADVHVDTYGTYVTTPEVSDDRATVAVTTTVANASGREIKATLTHTVIGPDGRKAASAGTAAVTIAAGGKTDIPASLTVAGPQLWDVDSPAMYSLVTTVKANGKTVDEYTTPFGIRSFEFDPATGFSLNGKPMKIKGLCLHMDDASRGVAVPDRSYERRLEILKEYGCNALRCSHNQPSPEFLDMADRMGFIVIDEAFDKWKSGYYEKYFDEWWQRDMADMILRDRNHPSIVLWSIGNELQEAWNGDNVGVDRARMLQDFVHNLEPTRPVTLAAQNNHQGKFSAVVDVPGYNYLEARAVSDHKADPSRCFIISEELPYYSGEEGNIRAYSTVNPWNIVMANDFIAGGFIWSGVDYLGEAVDGSRGWPNGLFDVCMNEKPRAAYHRAMWNPTPSVGLAVVDPSLDIDHGRDLWQWPKIASHWNWPTSYEGMIVQLVTPSNCETVKLYFNDKLMGEQRPTDWPNNTPVWNIPYHPGRVKAVGYNGTDSVAVRTMTTTGPAAALRAVADRPRLAADGQDLSHISITLVDDNGLPVQTDDRQIDVEVSGAGRFLGLDNGDLRRDEPFGSRTDRTYFGRALTVVQAGRTHGDITVTITSPGLRPVTLTITVGDRAD